MEEPVCSSLSHAGKCLQHASNLNSIKPIRQCPVLLHSMTWGTTIAKEQHFLAVCPSVGGRKATNIKSFGLPSGGFSEGLVGQNADLPTNLALYRHQVLILIAVSSSELNRLADATLSGYVQAAIQFCSCWTASSSVNCYLEILWLEKENLYCWAFVRQLFLWFIQSALLSSVDEQALYWDRETARTTHFICVLLISLPISTGCIYINNSKN